MSTEFGTQLDAIVASHTATQQQAKQKQAETQAAVAKFNQDWTQHRTTIIDPALREIVIKLKEKDIGAQIVSSSDGAHIYIAVTRAQTGVRGPAVSVIPIAGTQRVRLSRASRGDTRAIEVPPEQITAKLLEEQVLALIREFYGQDAPLGR
jgi:hypothetical protein